MGGTEGVSGAMVSTTDLTGELDVGALKGRHGWVGGYVRTGHLFNRGYTGPGIPTGNVN